MASPVAERKRFFCNRVGFSAAFVILLLLIYCTGALAANSNKEKEEIRLEAFIRYLLKNGLVLLPGPDANSWFYQSGSKDKNDPVRLLAFLPGTAREKMTDSLAAYGAFFELNQEALLGLAKKRFNSDSKEEKKLLELFNTYRPPPWRPVVYPRYDRKTGTASLCANEALLLDAVALPEFSFLGLWSFDPEKKLWTKLELPDSIPEQIRAPQNKQIYSQANDQELIFLTDKIGLFYARWKEDEHLVGRLVFAGPILCNDVRLAPAPLEMIPACVPFANRAEARYVPDPELYCK